jgi:pilus assembly protein CpaC
VIAEPNLTTVSGQPAHFFAGGEIPILVPQGGTLAGTVTVVYKKFGVILDFTPVVDLNGLITMHVTPEVSRIDKENSVVLAGFVIPGLTTRRASTTVKLWSGQCYAIAGLLQNERITDIDSLCGLDRLPVIGPIFRSRRSETKQTELMIVLAPYLVNTECQQYSEPVRTDLVKYECLKNDCVKVLPPITKPCSKVSKKHVKRRFRLR